MADLDYGVYGYLLTTEEEPCPGLEIDVTCSCGGAGAHWVSQPTDKKGYWETPFSSSQADAHDGHGMRAEQEMLGDYTEFTFHKPVTGPVVIYTTYPKKK